MANPKGSDAFSDIQKEITALRTLRDSSAKNINVVIEAEHYGSTVWLVTEYCSGGSISTLVSDHPFNVFVIRSDLSTR